MGMDKEALEKRVAQLETTVNESNFSDDLALSFNNIIDEIESFMNEVKNSQGNNYVTQIIESTLAIVTASIHKERNRLRQKA
jgi:hypothetical protein